MFEPKKVLVVYDLHEKSPEKGEGPSSRIQHYARQIDADAIIHGGDSLYGLWATKDEDYIFNRMNPKETSTAHKWIKNYKTVLDNLSNGNIPVYSIVGNHDGITHYDDEIFFHEPLGEEILNSHKEVFSIEKQKESIGDMEIGGVGGCKMIREGGATPVEYSERELESYLKKLGEVDILVTHSPPYNTKLDVSHYVFKNDEEKDKVYENGEVVGAHVGSKSIRKYIESDKPKFSTSGHIHESLGVDQIGNTKCINASYEGNNIIGIIDLEKEFIEIKPFN